MNSTPHTKQELIDWVESLPDETVVEGFCYEFSRPLRYDNPARREVLMHSGVCKTERLRIRMDINWGVRLS